MCLYISNTLHTFIPFNNKYFTILDTPHQYWTLHIGIKWKMISTFYPLSSGWCSQKLCLCLLASSPWLQSILLEPTELFARRLWLWSFQLHIPLFAYLKYKRSMKNRFCLQPELWVTHTIKLHNDVSYECGDRWHSLWCMNPFIWLICDLRQQPFNRFILIVCLL